MFPTPWLVLASTPPVRAPVNAAASRGPLRSTVLVRITSLGLTQQWILDHVHRLSKQLGGALVVVVDQSFCAGLACTQAWTARTVGQEATAFLYTSSEYASRWPLVRWPDLRNWSTIPRYGYGWYHQASKRFLEQLENASWPLTHEAKIAHEAEILQGKVSTKAELLWPYLIHEPSLVLWWEKYAVDRRRPVWVLEDDVVFYNPTHLVQYINRMDDALEGVDYAALLESKSDNCSLLLRPSWHTACNAARAWPVHKWEHVERFSPHMLSLLSNALDKGHVAHGELFASTLCRDSLFCKMRDFRDIDKASYRGILGGTDRKQDDVLFHHDTGTVSRWTHVRHGTVAASPHMWPRVGVRGDMSVRGEGWARADWGSLRERMGLSADAKGMQGGSVATSHHSGGSHPSGGGHPHVGARFSIETEHL